MIGLRIPVLFSTNLSIYEAFYFFKANFLFDAFVDILIIWSNAANTNLSYRNQKTIPNSYMAEGYSFYFSGMQSPCIFGCYSCKKLHSNALKVAGVKRKKSDKLLSI